MSNQIAYESITVSTAAIGPTAATATARVRCAVFYIKGAAVRYRGDGTSPSASVGRPIEDGGHLVLVGEGTIKNALFIRRDSVDATIHAEYYDNVDVVSSIAASNVEGIAAHDAPAAGNPVLIGAEADETSADNVDEGDVGKLRMSLARLLKTESSWGVPSHLLEDIDTLNDIDKEYTVTAGKIWFITGIQIRFETTATTGNRVLLFEVRGVATGNTVMTFQAALGTAQPASKQYEYYYIPGGGARETAVSGGHIDSIHIPIPTPFVLGPNLKLRAREIKGIDANDDIKIQIYGMEANL